MLLALLLACDPSVSDKAEPLDSLAYDSAEPEAPSSDWCLRVQAGGPSDEDDTLALAAAHAALRLFGPDPDSVTVDQALIAAWPLGQDPDLDAYASALTEACALDAQDSTLGPATLTLRGELAWVVPGSGALTLPEGVKGLVVDLRALPQGAEAEAYAALALGLATPVERATERVRRWEGFVDQVFSKNNAYSTKLNNVTPDPIPAGATVDLPLFLVTDTTLSPSAARIAGELKQAGRAWIVGEDLLAAVAEASWSPVGGRGLVWRGRTLLSDGDPWPDVIPADLRTDSPIAALAGLDPSVWPSPSPATGEATRLSIPKRDPWSEPWSEGATASVDPAAARVGLLSAYGVLRYFYPYFEVVGDTLDPRLQEVLDELDETLDTEDYRRLLGRLGESLHDGHCFFGTTVSRSNAGYLPVAWDHIEGLPVALYSNVPEILPGDTLLAVDGLPIEDLYADLLSWHGAATEGYALNLASRELMYMADTTTYTLRDPDGLEREVTVEPQGADSLDTLPFTPSLRDNGFLADLGAEDIAYLNMAGEVTTALSQVEALLSSAADAQGLVVDMRGYPGVDHYSVIKSLMTESFGSPFFNVHTWQGPDLLSIESSQYSFSPDADTFSGPIVLLVGPTTVSAAENFSMMLVFRDQVTVVGRRSAGTNGNITGVGLAGGGYLTFTGMEVLFPDGSSFHGTGIEPDREVSPTPSSIRDGEDRELEAAVALLQGGG